MSYALTSLYLLALQALPAEPAEEPLWRLLLRDFPLDAGAITLYVLLAASIALIWWGHRNSGRTGVQSNVGEDPRSALDVIAEEAGRPRTGREGGRAKAAERRTVTDRRPLTDGPPTTDRPPLTDHPPATPRRPRRAA